MPWLQCINHDIPLASAGHASYPLRSCGLCIPKNCPVDPSGGLHSQAGHRGQSSCCLLRPLALGRQLCLHSLNRQRCQVDKHQYHPSLCVNSLYSTRRHGAVRCMHWYESVETDCSRGIQVFKVLRARQGIPHSSFLSPPPVLTLLSHVSDPNPNTNPCVRERGSVLLASYSYSYSG